MIDVFQALSCATARSNSLKPIISAKRPIHSNITGRVNCNGSRGHRLNQPIHIRDMAT